MLNPFEKFLLPIPVFFGKIFQIKNFPNRPGVFKKSIPDTIQAIFSEPDFIVDNIYLGGIMGACNYEFFRNNNIKYVVNISDNIPTFFRDREIDYLMIEKSDNGREDLTREELDRAYNFISHAQEKEKNVLVHCFAGKSRSVAIVIYYLKRKSGLTINQCIDFIKERRRWINPSKKFIDNLTRICEKEEI